MTGTKIKDKATPRYEFKIRLYRYILKLLKFLSKLPNEPISREIKGQLTRSETSIGANCFGAYAASSKKDYQNYFRISLKSANESRFWLAILKDSGLTSKELLGENQMLLQETKEIANIFASSLLTMKNNK